MIAPFFLGQSTPSKADIIRDARDLAKSANAHAERNVKSRLMFMQDAEVSSKWSKMATEESHLDKDGMWAAGDVGFVWMQKGRVLLASISSGSGSGDWSANAEYVFRTNGTLARVEARYAAFAPIEGVVVRERIFDRTGKLVHEGVKCSTLGEKPKLIRGEKAKEMAGYAPKVPNYLSDRMLPFYQLLNPRPTSRISIRPSDGRT